jgi:hypothetical protein
MSLDNLDPLSYDSDGDDEARLIANQAPNNGGSIGAPDESPLLYELAAEDFPSFFAERNGRLFHAHLTSPYPLPVDTPEQQVNYIRYRTGCFCDTHLIFPSPAPQCNSYRTQPADWRKLRRASTRCPGARTTTSENCPRPLYRHREVVNIYSSKNFQPE